MSVESKLPDDHPMMVAWTEYQENASFKNSMNWIRGALWKAFSSGYEANKPTPKKLPKGE